jgi:hypothetical protein
MKTFFDSQTVPVNYLLFDNELHVLLDALRLFDLFTVCGITVSADKKSLQTTKNIMSIATSIAKAGFFPRGTGTREKQEGGGYGIESTYYSDADLTRILKFHGITFVNETKTTFQIADPSKLSKLRKYFILETIKHKIYEHSDHEPTTTTQIKTLDELLLSIGNQSDIEIDEVISEIDTIVSENSIYDTADAIIELNRLQQIAIPYADDADVIPTFSEINLSKLENKKRFKNNGKFKLVKSTKSLPKPISMRRAKLVESRRAKRNHLTKRKRSSSLSSESTKPFKRFANHVPLFGGNKTRRRRK